MTKDIANEKANPWFGADWFEPLEAAFRVTPHPSIQMIYARQFGLNHFFAFGDLLIDSDLLVTCLSTPTPVRMLVERSELADSVPAFLDKVLQGAFDFC